MICYYSPRRELSTIISKTLGRRSSGRILRSGGGSANNHSDTPTGSIRIWWWAQRWWRIPDPTTKNYRRGLSATRDRHPIHPEQQLLQTRAKGEDARGIHTHEFGKGEIGNTIYALATAPGRAAIAVVRVSGPACLNVCWMKLPIFHYHSVFVFLLLCFLALR